MTKRIGVIGAGISGLSVAHLLSQKGYVVDIFENQWIMNDKNDLYRSSFSYESKDAISVPLSLMIKLSMISWKIFRRIFQIILRRKSIILLMEILIRTVGIVTLISN